ncbi:uncharacterized protein LOC134016535 [Osmerus eperlanus]|uniref:uncharacterized protein LOC134016535 n=1 Tax=Osmerus eperlanus TaxID=29151 RepID=UPI002E117139
MELRTTGSVFVFFLCSLAVVLGQYWRVTYPLQSVCVLRGSSVDLSCSYTYPRGHKVTTTFWFTRRRDGEVSQDLSLDPEYAGLQVKVTPSTWGEKTLTCSSTCPLTGNPSYIWYKNGQHVKQASSQQLSVSSNFQDKYSCAVEGHEDLRSPAVCVYGQYCSIVTYSTRRLCVLKGSSVDISCTYYSYYTVTSSFWFSPGRRDGWRDRSGPEDLAGDPEYAGRVQSSGTERKSSTLTITHLRERDSGEYRFTFKTRDPLYDWGDSFSGTTLTVTGLQVKVTPSTWGEKTLTCSSTCPLTGNPSYIWYKNGQHVQQASSQQLSVSSNSQDRYSCAVEGHEDLRSPAVCVYGQYCSIVTYSTRRLCVLEGSSVDISCTYNSYDTVTSSFWFSPGRRDGERDRSAPENLAGDPEYAGRVQYSGTERKSSTMTITHLRERDSGEYRFTFKTRDPLYDWGDSFSGTTLTVTGHFYITV